MKKVLLLLLLLLFCAVTVSLSAQLDSILCATLRAKLPHGNTKFDVLRWMNRDTVHMHLFRSREVDDKILVTAYSGPRADPTEEWRFEIVGCDMICTWHISNRCVSWTYETYVQLCHDFVKKINDRSWQYRRE